MRLQFQETKELHSKEREAAEKEAELVALVQSPVVNEEKVNELSAENKHLKVQQLHFSVVIFLQFMVGYRFPNIFTRKS